MWEGVHGKSIFTVFIAVPWYDVYDRGDFVFSLLGRLSTPPGLAKFLDHRFVL